MNKACIINEYLYENMKEAFIDDVLNMMKYQKTMNRTTITVKVMQAMMLALDMLMMMKVSACL